MDAAQSLMQRVAPADLEKNLDGMRQVLENNPDSLDALLKKYQVPFQVVEPAEDGETKGEKPFLNCRYNLVGDKHRSPWTNRLHPVSADDNNQTENGGVEADEQLRLLELTVNEVWESYKNLYYGYDSVGSVFLKERATSSTTAEDGGGGGNAFKGLFGVYKKLDSGSCWHSVSIVHVDAPGEETCNYHVETTALVTVNCGGEGGDDSNKEDDVAFDVSSILSKETSKECKIKPASLMASHIENLGDLIESNEMDLRTQLERVQIHKAIETADTVVKKKVKSNKPAVNPLMAMMMDSSVLKKKIAKEAAGGE